jgi:AcrR family transcriptional regulator
VGGSMVPIERKSMARYSYLVAVRRGAAVREEPRVRLEVEERRKQLVALGIELFAERTYDDVSIDELAHAAGISKGLLYHYFPTKRDFYVATVKQAAQELLERTATPEGMDPLERVRAGLDAYLDYVVKHGKPYASLLRGGVGSDAEVAAIVDGTRDAFCARLLEGAPFDVAGGGSLLRIVLRGWIGFVEAATIEWIDVRRHVKKETLRDLLIQTLLKAVQAAQR